MIEELLPQAQESVDKLLCELLGREIEFAPLTVRTNDQFQQDFARQLGENLEQKVGRKPGKVAKFVFQTTARFVAQRHMGRSDYVAGVNYAVPNVIYYNPEKFKDSDEPTKLSMLAHEVTHQRVNSLGIQSQLKSPFSRLSLTHNRVYKLVEEGFAQYLSHSLYDPNTEHSDYSKFVQVKVQILVNKVNGKELNPEIASKLTYAESLFPPDIKCYYTGEVFFAFVSRMVSQRAALDLALNPLKPGVDIKDPETLRRMRAKDESIFRVSSNEIENPEQYLSRKRSEQRASIQNALSGYKSS